jgi:hypothetical protein
MTMQGELYDHGGWMLYDGEWVEVDKNKRAASKS